MKIENLPIIIRINQNVIFSDKNFLALKNNFLNLIQERLKSLNNVVYCPILNKKLTTKFIIGLFDFQFSRDKKTIKIMYSKKTINNRTAEDIIRSIDYGTIDFKPRRIFYPIFDKFSRNSLKYMH